MLSSIYQILFDFIKNESIIEENKLFKILLHIEARNSGSYIYPESLVENFNITDKEMKRLLILLVNQSILKKVYKVYCPACHSFSDEMFNNFSEAKSYEICDECGSNLVDEDNPTKYLVVYFEVI